jgi:hypothetical protein
MYAGIQVEIVESQHCVELHCLRRKGLCGHGAKGKRREKAGGAFLFGNCDHFSGNIRRKIA